MKKIILLAGILTTGIMSANTFISDKEVLTKILEKDSEISKLLYPIYYTTSCGVPCVTNQTYWTESQIMAWTSALEQNYCNETDASEDVN